MIDLELSWRAAAITAACLAAASVAARRAARPPGASRAGHSPDQAPRGSAATASRPPRTRPRSRPPRDQAASPARPADRAPGRRAAGHGRRDRAGSRHPAGPVRPVAAGRELQPGRPGRRAGPGPVDLARRTGRPPAQRDGDPARVPRPSAARPGAQPVLRVAALRGADRLPGLGIRPASPAVPAGPDHAGAVHRRRAADPVPAGRAAAHAPGRRHGGYRGALRPVGLRLGGGIQRRPALGDALGARGLGAAGGAGRGAGVHAAAGAGWRWATPCSPCSRSSSPPTTSGWTASPRRCCWPWRSLVQRAGRAVRRALRSRWRAAGGPGREGQPGYLPERPSVDA